MMSSSGSLIQPSATTLEKFPSTSDISEGALQTTFTLIFHTLANPFMINPNSLLEPA